MKIQLALALLLASAVAHAEVSPYSSSTPPPETQGDTGGVQSGAQAGAETVRAVPEDQLCDLAAGSLLDRMLVLLAGAGCNDATTSGNLDTELQLDPR